MSADEKLVTEREAVERERKAFVAGVSRAGMLYEPSPEYWHGEAARRYLPKVRKPRTYTEGEFTFRVMDGKIVHQASGDRAWYAAFELQTVEGAESGGCTIGGYIPATPTLLAALADLLANPTEEVDA